MQKPQRRYVESFRVADLPPGAVITSVAGYCRKEDVCDEEARNRIRSGEVWAIPLGKQTTIVVLPAEAAA